MVRNDCFNCDVNVVSLGMEALEICDKMHFDLILLDIGLPDIDGFEVAKRLRTRPGHNHKTPIIGVSAHVLQSQLDKKHYLDDILSKPITYELCDQLVETLAHLYDNTFHI